MAAPTALKIARYASLRVAVLGSLTALQFLGCAVRSTPLGLTQGGALRIRDVVEEGDPQRRASTRLVLAGLSAENPQHAVSHYERAIKVDATNPYAFLALAAYEIQWGDVERGEQALNQAVQLFGPERLLSPRVVPHLDGLRGRTSLRMSDGTGVTAPGAALLERARRAAPDVWGDAWLTAEELR